MKLLFQSQQLATPLFHVIKRTFRKAARLEDLPDAHLLPLVALVGRPNVGKSALFNRLVRKRDALVYDTPGDHVTRDYREGLGQIGDLRFRVIDTSGLEPSAPPTSLQGRAAALTRGVLNSSHGVLMLLDARQGFVPGDEELLSWLRRNNNAPVMMLANKADTAAGQNNLAQLQADLAGLGLDPATPISATSGEGLADLYQLLQPLVDDAVQQLQQQQATAGPAGTRSSSSSRHYIPPVYRFSAETAQVVPSEQSQQDAQHEFNAVGSIGSSSSSTGLDAEEQLLSDMAAAEEAAVDRLVQQHLASSGSDTDTDTDQDMDDDTALAAADANADGAGADATSLLVGGVDGDGYQSDNNDGKESAGSLSLGPLRLAILGLPNAGKSTLMNTLLGYERSLTGPEPGLTRDPTSGWLHHAGVDLQLIDTAGWKRPGAVNPTQSPTVAPQKGKPGPGKAVPAKDDSSSSGSSKRDSLSKQLADASLAQAKRALSAVHVAVLLLDAPRLLTIEQAITRLELQLASLALTQGKALVIGLNKADAVPGGPAAEEALRERVAELLDAKFLAAGRLPVLSLSALSGNGADQLLDAVVEAYGKWNKQVSSYKLRASLAKHSLRFYGTGGTSKLLARIKWAIQLKPRPPTFVLLLRGADEVDEGGQRFLSNLLRESLGLQGVPLRLHLRYNKRKQQRQQHTSRSNRRRGRQRH